MLTRTSVVQQMARRRRARDSKTSFRGILKSRGLVEAIYSHRTRMSVWISVVLLSILLAVLSFILVLWLNDTLTPRFETRHDWLSSPGPWTFVLLVSSAPIGFLLWCVRDRNKHADIRIARDQIIHRDAEHAQKIFENLQGWAAGSDLVLKTSALYQLEGFICARREGEGFIPKEILQERNPFEHSGMAIIRALLDDRSWLKEWEKRFEDNDDQFWEKYGLSKNGKERIPKCPVLMAIESIITNSNKFVTDYSNWNLSNLDLSYAKFDQYHMYESEDGSADYVGVDFDNAKLIGTNMMYAKCDYASFRDALLTECDFSHADLTGVDFSGADLTDTIFKFAKLHRAIVGERWEPILSRDIRSDGYEGVIHFVSSSPDSDN